MRTFFCWHWRQPRWSATYRTEHVNALARMMQQHMKSDYRLVCVTDARNLKDYECETYPMWKDKRLVVQTAAGRPNCYQRLRLFGQEVQDKFGPDLVSIDLDCLITGDLTPLFADDAQAFRICKGAASPYNGSMWQVRGGIYPEVYNSFDPLMSPGEASKRIMYTAKGKAKNYYGSDQAWISHMIHGATTWTPDEGVYHFSADIKDHKMKGPPKNARVIFFAGLLKPWMTSMRKDHSWIHQLYHRYVGNR